MNDRMRVVTFAAFVVFGLWVLFLLITLGLGCSGALQSFGNMGDAFGILNTLFAGLALAAIVAQLWMQQMQIDDERNARHNAERISALTTLIQLTYEKLSYERKLLLEVVPSFDCISFFHDRDLERLRDSIQARTSYVEQKEKDHSVRIKNGIPVTTDEVKELQIEQKSIPLMRQVAKLVEELQMYENQIKDLLKGGLDKQTKTD